MQFRAAGRDSQNFRADKFSATNIKRSVADHDDFLRLQIFPKHAPTAFERGDGDLVAFFVVVGKCAEMKIFPKVVAAQFEFRAEFDIAGKQAERRRIFEREQIADEILDAVTNLTVAVRENVVEPENVALEKFREMFRRFVQAMDFEKFADEADVGASGKFYFFRTVMEIEFRRERFGKRLRAGVAGVNERAVNIE